MVRGIGVDIIEIARVQRAIDQSGSGFLEKVFTPSEIAYCSGKYNSAQHFAARFAAKEAVSKALSTGWAGSFRWKDVEIVNELSGQPRVIAHGPLKEQLSSASIFVSISHSETHVVAMVVIEGTPS